MDLRVVKWACLGFISFLPLLSSTSFAETTMLFDKTHVFFNRSENRRSVESTVEFPSREEQFDHLNLTVKLSCPAGGCDFWDRFGTISLIDDAKGEIEIFRFMTPYRTGATWQLDVTDLRPLFSGQKKLKVFIDTWVGPGSAQGNGWIVDAKIDFKPGQPRDEVLDVVPLFHPTSVVYGDPARAPILNTQVNAINQEHKGRLWTWITGHGQGNTANCAEFCPKNHTLSLGDFTANRVVWRSNCRDTVTDGPQMGTWIYDRAGWCPGAKVEPWIVDLPQDVFSTGDELVARWIPEAYTNTARGGYNGGMHTEPYYQVSALLIILRG